MELVVKKQNDNPFYGMKSCLKLLQDANKPCTEPTLQKLLNEAWKEAKGSKEKRDLFFTILFSVGDITSRFHNIFLAYGIKNIDNGGAALRDNFNVIFKWIRDNNYQQFLSFLNNGLFNEFTSFDTLLAMRVKTMKKTSKFVGYVNNVGFDEKYLVDLASYISKVIKTGNDFDKFLVAKFLTRPRLSKRSGHKKLLPETKTIMLIKQKLITYVSDNCNFSYTQRTGYTDFKGFYQWRKQQTDNKLESVLFSSGKIKEFDQEQFLSFINSIPASARFRVRKRILTPKDEVVAKYGSLGTWFLQWEKFKEGKQGEQRILEEKVRQKTASTDDIIKLQQVKKDAKVTVGAVSFQDLMKEVVSGTVDEVKIQPFLDKIKLQYNTLVFIDDSGSMQSSYFPGVRISAFDFAVFMATIALMKNPSDTGRSLLGYFSYSTRMVTHITAVARPKNNLMVGTAKEVSLPLYNGKLSFLRNHANIKALSNVMRTYNGTNISSIPGAINAWTQGDSTKIEQIMEFPIWTIITDGNWNNLSSPEASMNDFMSQCMKYFGFKPYIIAIDVSSNSVDVKRLQGIENLMFVPANFAMIEQYLTNFSDMDVYDVYTPLQTMFRSNRYNLVRQFTL